MATAKKKAVVEEGVVEMHTRRLLRMARDIERRKVARPDPDGMRLPRTKLRVGKWFDMATWGLHFGRHKNIEQCGTVACALGSAALNPAAQKEGLVPVWGKTGTLLTMDVQYVGKDGVVLYDAEAGAEFFGLTYYEAHELFLTIDRTKAQVVENVRWLALHREETYRI